jgi:uncharacterized protein YcfJ
MKKNQLAALMLLTMPGGVLAQHSSYVDVPVVSNEPIVEVITRKIPHEQCHDAQVRVDEPASAHSPTPGLLGAVVGGAAGGAAGEDSRYQPLLIGAGALLGASIGTDVAHQRGAQSYYVTQRRCGVDYELRDTERVVGYRVGYRYQNDVYYMRTDTPPGDRIRVRVDVSPVD